MERRTLRIVLALVAIVTGGYVFESSIRSSPPPSRPLETRSPAATVIPLPQGRITLVEDSNAAPPSRAAAALQAPLTITPTPIPTSGEEVGGGDAANAALRPDGRIDLNRASPEELMALPGVGEKRAADIVADRERRGPFASVADLDRVKGMGPKSIERLAPLLIVDGTGNHMPFNRGGAAPKATVGDVIRINIADAAELESLSGVGPVLARKIIDHRRLHGPFRGAQDLEKVSGVGPAFFTRNEGRIRYD